MEPISTTYLANKYNRSNATICHILKDSGAEPVDIGEHNCSLWNPDVEEIVKKAVETQTRFVNGRKYAEELDVPYDTFLEVIKQFGITDTHRICRNKRIEEYIWKMKKETPKLSLEQMKMLHPLVKDERCFNINWWPDTMPICFKDLEE